ncbi:MAG: c-type cytochrome [Saprospiraceae bacterium]|nr:c-type cytochrome [Saprospiraceae bacterium]
MQMRKLPGIAGVLAVLVLGLNACVKDNVSTSTQYYTAEEYATLSAALDLPAEPIDYQVALPVHLTQQGLKAPIINNHKAALGRVLFYDKNLSQNKTVSCASCHKQELAFSDDKAFSEGFDGRHTKRNTLALAAAANFESSYGGDGNGGSFSGFSETVRFFWDERANSIMEQSRMTIQDDIEMGMPMHEVVARIQTIPHYQVLFRKAYGATGISEDRVLEAIREFLNSFVSVNSKFDEGLARTNDPFSDFDIFTSQENIGKRIYMENCASCHSHNLSTAVENLANNGLDAYYTDQGRALVTGVSQDEGIFKVPFLRNIALTGPYMHDGRFNTLEEVVEHYNSGIQNHPNLDFRLRDPFTLDSPKRLQLTDSQKQSLIAFLHTLTDEEFVADVRFMDPFR